MYFVLTTAPPDTNLSWQDTKFFFVEASFGLDEAQTCLSFIAPPDTNLSCRPGIQCFQISKTKCTNTILRGLNKTCSNKTCLNKTCSNKTCLDKTCSNKTCLNKKYLNKTCLNLVPTEGVLGFRGIETLLNHEKCFLFYKKHFSLNVF